MLCMTLVSCSQTQPSATRREGSGQPTILAFVKSVELSGKLVIEFITVVLNSAYWESIVMNILILIMNIISGLSPTKIAKNLAKLLTNASTMG